jgi:hypothetical protein
VIFYGIIKGLPRKHILRSGRRVSDGKARPDFYAAKGRDAVK